MRIDSVRFDASGNATLVASGGISFFIPISRISDIPEGLPSAGDELDPEDSVIAVIARIAEEEAALSKAIDLCQRAEQSSRGLRSKLAGRGFSREAIDYALRVLEKQRIINDVRYASIWARTRAEHRMLGPMQIGSELRARGFSESTARAALAAIDFDSILEKAISRGLYGVDTKSLSSTMRESLKKSLKVKGFGTESINRWLEKMT